MRGLNVLSRAAGRPSLPNAIAILDVFAGPFDSRTHDGQTKKPFDRAHCRYFGDLMGHRMMPAKDFIKRRSARMAN